jgi:hypothetical protein
MSRTIARTTRRSQLRALLTSLTIALGCEAFLAAPGMAGEAIITPPDSNSRITVENAVTSNGETTVFFVSWPYRGDPQSGKPCPLNYYAATVRSGLASPRLETVAKGVCGGLIQNSALHSDGTASILIAERWERWRGGKQLDSKTLASLEALAPLGFGDTSSLPQNFEPASNGDLVATVFGVPEDQGRGLGGALSVARLAPNGVPRWANRPGEVIDGVMEARIWPGPGGGALLQAVIPAEGDALLVYDPRGNRTRLQLSTGDPMLAVEKLGEMDPRQAEAFFISMADSKPESIEQVAAQPAADGGWDVLFERRGPGAREGHFLLRIGADGDASPEQNLAETLASFGLEDWYDFHVAGSELVLLSRALVTQKVINGRPRGRAQNVVSWIDLESGEVSPHLLPLDERYLDAALAAGDAELQYLDGLPDSEPVLLSHLGDQPLVASVGWVERRQVLRLQEASRNLKPFTEAVDRRRAAQAKTAARAQRKADREALAADLEASQAAAAGMSVEAFRALSEDEQTEAIIRNGGAGQLIQSAMQQSDQRLARQRATDTGSAAPATPQAFDAQLAAAMAQAQQELANTPGVTPEMLAQMQAAMGGVSQGVAGAPTGAAAAPAAGSGTTIDEASILALDPAGRAFLEFEGEKGQALVLRIFERGSGRDLMTRDYADGVIYEYIDFNRFKLPFDRIGIQFLDSGGAVLRELTPATRP